MRFSLFRQSSGRDGTGRDGTGRDGTGRDGTDNSRSFVRSFVRSLIYIKLHAIVLASRAFLVVGREHLDVGDDFGVARVFGFFGEVGVEIAGRGNV